MKAKLNYLFTVIFLAVVIVSCSNDVDDNTEPAPTPTTSKIEHFTFTSNGAITEAKIYLPASFEANKKLPAIFLIDFTEQHFIIAEDEFEKVIEGVEQIEGFDALVVTLEEHLNIESSPNDYQEYYDLYRDMTAYVDAHYTGNTSRTFIGRGSEAGLVLIALFLEDPETSVFDNFIATDSPINFNSFVINMIDEDDFPQNKQNKKLHFSFSSSNNYNSCANLISTIEDAQFPWLQFESKQYSTTFPTTYPESFADGIKYIYDE